MNRDSHRDRQHCVDSFSLTQRATAMQGAGEIFALEKLHDEIRHVLLDADVADVHDMGWRSAPRFSASRRNVGVRLEFTRPACIVFSATGFLSKVWVASNTLPCPLCDATHEVIATKAADGVGWGARGGVSEFAGLILTRTAIYRAFGHRSSFRGALRQRPASKLGAHRTAGFARKKAH